MDKSLISISIAILITQIAANQREHCKQYDNCDFKVCGYSDVITSITKTRNSWVLALNLNDFSAIAPHAFENVTISNLQLSDRNSIECTPKFIQMTPESFDGLYGVSNLVLDCLMFKMEPNPFGNLKSVVSVRLERVEFAIFGQIFLEDFHHLKRLSLHDVKISTISSDIFSKISEGLVKLWVSDELKTIEPKSFARFHHLESLVLRGGQFDDLPNDIFHGLKKLKHLDLSNDKIQVLSPDVFSGLPQLEELCLNSNRISQIAAHTFSGLNNLKTLDLQNNNLGNIPTEVFSDLENLVYLSLRSNKIRIVESDLFRGCPNLRRLDLSKNNINYIEPAAFSGLHLHLLSLNKNDIKVLRKDTFYGLRVDPFLGLDDNDIVEIEPFAFRNLTAGVVSLCWHHLATRSDLDDWGVVNNSIGRIGNRRCGGVDTKFVH